MSKLGEALRAIDVINTHDILRTFGERGKTDIACCYHPREPRMVRPSRTLVYSPSHKTDPKAHFTDYDRKCFVGDKAESMPQAIEWASARYGITDWATCPTDRSTKIPLVVYNKARDAIKKAKGEA